MERETRFRAGRRHGSRPCSGGLAATRMADERCARASGHALPSLTLCAYEHSGYRVPARCPFLLRERRNKLPGVDDRMIYLDDPTDPTEYEDVADALWNVFLTARDLAPLRTRTGCGRHPQGPVDTEAPDGWGHCLLCNRHRRIGRPQAKAGQGSGGNLWAVPGPPYSHAGLMDTRVDLKHVVQDLEPFPSWRC